LIGKPTASSQASFWVWRSKGAAPASSPQPPQLVGEEREGARGGDGRVELPERARRRVARVHVQRLALLLAAGVQTGEVGPAEEDLASDLDPPGNCRTRSRRPERERDDPDGAEVGGDVLAHGPVAAGGALHQRPVLVHQLHREPVELGLADVGDVLRPEHPVHPGVELDQLLVGEGVGEAEHLDPVGHRPELLRGGAGHPRRRRVGGPQRRKLGLDGLELTDQRVVLGVAELRVIQDVVAVVGPGDLRLQLLGSGSGGVGVHG